MHNSNSETTRHLRTLRVLDAEVTEPQQERSARSLSQQGLCQGSSNKTEDQSEMINKDSVKGAVEKAIEKSLEKDTILKTRIDVYPFFHSSFSLDFIRFKQA